MTFLPDALDYAARAWCILPVTHTPKPKRVALRSWKRWQASRPDEDTLRRWFARADLDGLAVVCGPVSGGLAVRDFDTLPAYERWMAMFPKLAAALPTVATYRGRHVYFRADMHRIIDVERDGVHEGEYRGAGIVLLPPSRHPSGSEYRWVVTLTAGELPYLDPTATGLLPADVLFNAGGELVQKENRKKRTENRGNPKDTECNVSAVSAGAQTRKAERIDLDALDEGTVGAIARALRGCQPSGHGQRHRAVFKLARTLRGLPALANADVRDLRPLVRQFHELALPFIGTKDFDETWTDFIYGWGRVKHPRGCVMNAILDRAKSVPMPAEANRYETPALRLLVAVCHELQVKAGDGPFYLSARMAGELLAQPAMTAWRYLGTLAGDGVLQVVQRGENAKGAARRRATRYRYVAGGDDQAVTAAKTAAIMHKLTSALARKPREGQIRPADRMAELRRQAEDIKRANDT
ncbi:MAG: bifunctional DNA primase/polymerase [Planctomycetes bacterium]|nr:bifunctional DNA primase/polymerase [Planctomycetota bacterium]